MHIHIDDRNNIMDLLDLHSVKNLLADSNDCLIGVSGGLDSMVMLSWFAQHRQHFSCSFRVMHVDHGISADSEKWAEFVKDTCRSLNIACEVATVDLSGLGNNLEYAARKARYRAFCESGADSLILAHHGNDQCESFLLKLFRGSGIRGLKAMSPKTACWYDEKITVLRPLLHVTRNQITEWANINGIRNIEDASNQDVKYDRNYIRNVIWPVIQERFDIADINTVRSIGHLAEAWELTAALADLDLANTSIGHETLDWVKVKSLGYLRIKNMILRILDKDGVYGFSVNHIEHFAKGLIDADFDSRNELRLKGFAMHKVGKRIYLGEKCQKSD